MTFPRPIRVALDAGLSAPRRARSKAKFCHQRIEPKARFDPRSFRTVIPKKGVRIVVGCPKGKYDARRKKCKVGTRAQSKLVRLPSRSSCCPKGYKIGRSKSRCR